MSRLAQLLPLRSVGAAVLCTLALTLPASSAATFTYTTFDPPGSVLTNANGVNKAGQIVGQYSAGGTTHAFLRNTDGTFTTIDPPGTTRGSAAYGIDKSGRIVGFLSDTTMTHGFLRETDGTFTTIDPPGSAGTFPAGVSGKRIAGYFVGSDSVQHGFVATK